MPDCDYSLLPVESCSHCMATTDGHPAEPERSRSFIARYDGQCAARCGWPVEQGERIRWHDGLIFHARCG